METLPGMVKFAEWFMDCADSVKSDKMKRLRYAGILQDMSAHYVNIVNNMKEFSRIGSDIDDLLYPSSDTHWPGADVFEEVFGGKRVEAAGVPIPDRVTYLDKIDEVSGKLLNLAKKIFNEVEGHTTAVPTLLE